VDIGVAILAVLPHIIENRFDVALGAADRLVHPAQRIAGLIVIEFRNRPDGFPSRGGVAVLTGDIQIAVRTVRPPGSLRRRTSWCSRKRQ